MSQSFAEKLIGYGIWIVITGLLVISLGINVYEHTTIHEEERSSIECSYNNDDCRAIKYNVQCYYSLTANYDKCGSKRNADYTIGDLGFTLIIFLGFNLANFFAMFVKWYRKQTSFRLRFCSDEEGKKFWSKEEPANLPVKADEEET